MGRDNLTEQIRSSWEIILQQITSPAKEKVNGQTSYICPLCGHGTHGDGLTANPKSPDGNGLKCFGCDFSGDIIDLIGEAEHITDYREKLRRAGELAGVDVSTASAQKDFSPASESEHSYNKSERPEATYTPEHTQDKAEENNLSYYRECQAILKKTGYRYTAGRGLSPEVATRFMLGLERNFKTQDKDTEAYTTWEVLIIPTGYNSYNARNTDPNASQKNRYRNRGEKTPFNLKALQTAQKPIYIVEGEIDALSIIEVGGEAVALGGVAIKNLAKHLKEKKPSQPLVIALDNDETGQKGTEELVEALEGLGIKYYIFNPAGDYKDANEALQASPETFRKAVAEAEKLEAEAFEEQKAEYLKTATNNHLQAFIDDIAEKANTRAQSTGFFSLDQVLDGGFYPGLYVLGAISSLGKTTLALQIMDNIAQQGRDVIIFSLEMSRYELMAKSISRHTFTEAEETGRDVRLAKSTRGITTGDRYRMYIPEEKQLIQDAINLYGEYAGYIYINEALTEKVDRIGTDFIRETLAKHTRFREGKRPPVVLIDYLQLLAPHNERMTDKQAVDKNVMELKRISREFSTEIIAISSVNRSNYMMPIDFESFKESGAIEFSADVVMGLQLACLEEELFSKEGKVADKRARIKGAKAENPRQIQLLILKNRNGETSTRVDFDYYPVFNAFIEH